MKKKMSWYEIECLRLEKKIVKFKIENKDMSKNIYPIKLIPLIEKYIEVYGHAYCMDVKKERKKISKMIYFLLNELKIRKFSNCF